jgi:mannose-6-phosphate isomerase-like protein (cupin superfamily)
LSGTASKVEKVNIAQKFKLFDDHWSPRIIGAINDLYIKLVKVKGEFVWHSHKEEDELFLVIKDRLTIKTRDRDVDLQEGEFVIVPKGVEHKPVSKDEAYLMLLERNTTINTGNVRNERTALDQWI